MTTLLLTEKENETRSRFISYCLRHGAEELDLAITTDGWVDVLSLLNHCQAKFGTFSFAELREIVETDKKGRYVFGPSDLSIRATQGHTLNTVQIGFTKIVPPGILYHGTNLAAWPQINATGLKPMGRHHVHLSRDRETAKAVGDRRKNGIVIFVESALMHRDGIEFYESENGVVLVDFVDPKYITNQQW